MSRRVPSKDYARQYAALWPELGPALTRVFVEENPILGASVAAFEADFAAYTGTRFAVGVGSGTDALILSLRALGIGAGDEVVTAANTFTATVTAILAVGARPVLVDPDPGTLDLDAERVAHVLGANTRAVIPVHLYGRLCPMRELVELCRAHGVMIVEDAAQSHGAYDGGRAGAFGVAGCFSFHPSKNLGAFGDGGIVTTDDEVLAGTLGELRNLGKRGKHEFCHVASNSKLDSIQAAVLRIKLRHLDAWNARRREIAATYHAELGRCAELRLPVPPVDAEHVFHLYPVHTARRDELRGFLAESGVRAGVHYPTPPHLQPLPVDLGYSEGAFPIAEQSAAEELSLPISHELEDDEIAYVCERIHAFFG